MLGVGYTLSLSTFYLAPILRCNMARATTRRKASPGSKKRQMTKKKMGIILGSVAAAVAAAVAIGVKRKDLENILKKQFNPDNFIPDKKRPGPEEPAVL